jgi:hypothetical protein
MVVLVRISSTSALGTRLGFGLKLIRQQGAAGAARRDEESSFRADQLQHPYGSRHEVAHVRCCGGYWRPPTADPGAWRRSLDSGGTLDRAGTAGAACSSALGAEHVKSNFATEVQTHIALLSTSHCALETGRGDER